MANSVVLPQQNRWKGVVVKIVCRQKVLSKRLTKSQSYVYVIQGLKTCKVL